MPNNQTTDSGDRILAVALYDRATGATVDGSSTSGTGTSTSPANAVTVFTILAANTVRKGAAITCEGSAVKVFLGAAASATVYTVAMAVGDYYEVPFGYTGIITGISTSATGNLRVTELT